QAAVDGELAASFSKLEGYAARLALVHHVVDRVAQHESDHCPIGRTSMEAGIALSQWFAGEARRIYSTLGETIQETETRRLVEFIESRGGQISARELQRSSERKYPRAETAEAALQALVEAELAGWCERP